MKKRMFPFIFTLLAVLISACGGDEFQKTPVDNMIKDMANEKKFTIILHDMDVDEGVFSDDYKHKYQIIKEKDSVPYEETTDWMPVSETFFYQHINDMGMEIAAKTADGKISKAALPPGYSNYVGNSNYGQWKTNSSGDSFWEFYGKFALMSSVLNMMTYPMYRSSYMGYYNGGYRGTGRSYYGPRGADGRAAYGTNSKHVSKTRGSSTWASKPSSFRNKVSNRVSRSTSRTGTSSRSRSGGFGK